MLGKLVQVFKRLIRKPPKIPKEIIDLDLLEPFKDFDVVVYDSKPYQPSIKRKRIIELHRQPCLNISEIRQSMKSMRKKYPKIDFYHKSIRGRFKKKVRTYHVIGREYKDKPDIPFYYNISLRKFYVNKKDYSENPRLTNIVVMMRLSSLGIPYRSKIVG